MIQVVPFKAEHLTAIKLQHAQMYLSELVTQEQAVSLETQDSYTATLDGHPVGAGGIIPQWAGRSIAWAFIAEVGPKNFLYIHRAVKRFIDSCYVKRLEITVDCEFEAGHRWAGMLGFTKELDRMVAYRPDGGDCALYARIL